MPAKMKLKNGATADFQLVDNGDDSMTVQGKDSAGNAVDISSLGTVAWSSSDESKVTVSPAEGPTASMSAVGPTTDGTPVEIKAVFTPTDGSTPLTGTLEVTVVTGQANDLSIVPGPVTTH